MAKQLEIVRNIGSKLLSKSNSIRRIFKTLDQNYYGYLSTEQYIYPSLHLQRDSRLLHVILDFELLWIIRSSA